MKKILSSLLLNLAVASAADTTMNPPNWISIKPVDGSELSAQVDAEVVHDKKLRRKIKDLEFLKNVLTGHYQISSMDINGLLPLISHPINPHSTAPGDLRYLGVDFPAIAPFVAVKLCGRHTAESVASDLVSLYAQATADRKKRKELNLLQHILTDVLSQDPSFNFSFFRQTWIEENNNGMYQPHNPALISSRSIVDVYSFGAPATEQPVKVEMKDVYRLLSQRFNVDYLAQVDALRSKLKSFKADQRYFSAANRILKKLDPSNAGFPLMSDDGTYQSLSNLLGSIEFYNPELKSTLPVVYAESANRELRQFLAEISGEQFSTNGRFIIKAQGADPVVNRQEKPNLGDPATLISFKDGQMYRGDSLIADDMTHNLIYAVDADGRLCVQVPGSSTTPNHDRFFTINDQGQPIACGGHVSIQGGKIMKIDTCSGHYMPVILQLVMVVSYLNEQRIIDPDCIIQSYNGEVNGYSLNDIIKLAHSIELHS